MPHDYGMYCVWGSVELNLAVVSCEPPFFYVLPRCFADFAAFSLLPFAPAYLPTRLPKEVPQLLWQQPTDKPAELRHEVDHFEYI
jgi:hypothetical protein